MSKYYDILGRGYKRTYVVVVDIDGLIVSGIFNSYEKALGHVMVCINEFSKSYESEGDLFEIGKLEECENGDSITVRFQYHTWNKPCEETYQILFYDERKRKWDKPKEKKVAT